MIRSIAVRDPIRIDDDVHRNVRLFAYR